MRLPQPPLLLITDRRLAREPLEAVVAAATRGGCRWVSLREKDLPPDERLRLLRRLVGLGREAGACVMAHGDVDAVAAAGAHGVHLPSGGDAAAVRRRLGPGALIGLSTHGTAEAKAAAGVDYVTLSPVYSTASKPGYGPALGPGALAEVRDPPVVALGGIDAQRAAECMRAGAAGVAVMGGIMAARDPEAATARLVEALAGTEEGVWRR